MNRNAALLLMLAALGLFIAEIMFRAEIWHWLWVPRVLRLWVVEGVAEMATLLAALAGAYFWLRRA